MDVSVEELILGVERDFTNRQIWSQLLANKFADDVELHSIGIDHVMRSAQVILESLVIFVLNILVIRNNSMKVIVHILYSLNDYLGV